MPNRRRPFVCRDFGLWIVRRDGEISFCAFCFPYDDVASFYPWIDACCCAFSCPFYDGFVPAIWICWSLRSDCGFDCSFESRDDDGDCCCSFSCAFCDAACCCCCRVCLWNHHHRRHPSGIESANAIPIARLSSWIPFCDHRCQLRCRNRPPPTAACDPSPRDGSSLARPPPASGGGDPRRRRRYLPCCSFGDVVERSRCDWSSRV